jgi:hypothetical protein
MSEEDPLILGDAFAAEMGQNPRRRRARRKKTDRPPLTHCENCGAELTGPYCAKCGQAAIDYHRSFGAVMADAADAFFNVDARILTTFGLVLVKPWRLTNEFLAGRRQRYVHPLRVYLMASLTFFLVIKSLEHFGPPRKGEPPIVIDHGSSKASGSPGASPRSTASPSPRSTARPSPANESGLSIKVDDDQAKSKLGKWLKARVEEKIGPGGSRGDLFLKALIDNLPYMVLCSIPLFAMVLKILYLWKRRYYIEHLVFALHTHAFVFLSTVVIIGIGFLLNWKVPGLTPVVCTFLGFAVLIELLVSVRRVYRQNWFATLFKFAFGSLIYYCLLTIAFVVTAIVTVLLP